MTRGEHGHRGDTHEAAVVLAPWIGDFPGWFLTRDLMRVVPDRHNRSAKGHPDAGPGVAFRSHMRRSVHAAAARCGTPIDTRRPTRRGARRQLQHFSAPLQGLGIASDGAVETVTDEILDGQASSRMRCTEWAARKSTDRSVQLGARRVGNRPVEPSANPAREAGFERSLS